MPGTQTSIERRRNQQQQQNYSKTFQLPGSCCCCCCVRFRKRIEKFLVTFSCKYRNNGSIPLRSIARAPTTTTTTKWSMRVITSRLPSLAIFYSLLFFPPSNIPALSAHSIPHNTQKFTRENIFKIINNLSSIKHWHGIVICVIVLAVKSSDKMK